MMIIVRTIITILRGIGRLLYLDRSGLVFFASTQAAARRSFLAALLVVPFHFLSVFSGANSSFNETGIPLTQETVQISIISVADYVIRWTAWPVLLWSLCSFIGCSNKKYFHYLTVSNWFSAAESLILLAVALTSPEGDEVNFFVFALLVSLLFYEWFIIRHALVVTAGTAFLLVTINLILGLLITRVTQLVIVFSRAF